MADATRHADETAQVRPPRGARWAGALIVAGLVAGAVYLVAVRGDALLVDLSALAGRVWCF